MRAVLVAAGLLLGPMAPAWAQAEAYLLETNPERTAEIVPIDGMVEWLSGTDDAGHATLAGALTFPDKQLLGTILFRTNSDAMLPASHLFEIEFTVPGDFAGGSIAQLPGILLKDEALVQGQPLKGASARVVGNSFLFALSGNERDAPGNLKLLTANRWLDIAVIYATGQRAIVTLQLDQTAQDTLKAMQ